MNFIGGKRCTYEASIVALEGLEADILNTLNQNPLKLNVVLEACDQISKTLISKTNVAQLMAVGMSEEKAKRELEDVQAMLNKEALLKRLEIELGTLEEGHAWKPLGVLLHIAAGNVDALPAYSVIEGLLTGNINLLKLPGGGDVLSILLLEQLITIEPTLAPYVYAFAYPSERLDLMEKLVACADAIVLWGSDEAVMALRRLAPPNVKLIEWGHKISFGYVSGDLTKVDVKGLAYNICDTNQLLCTACQGIYVDTASYDEVQAFAERFAKVLDEMATQMPIQMSPFTRAHLNILLHTEQLESRISDPLKPQKKVYPGSASAVICYSDGALTPSYKFRTCWVKPLPKDKILQTLKKHKSHLQTVGLVSTEDNRAYLERLLITAGVQRITSGEEMSKGYLGMPHDGKFALREYMKITALK